MEAPLRGVSARANGAKPSSATTQRRRRQCASAQFPRSSSLVPRALRESDSDARSRDPWPSAAKKLASRATALALAVAVSTSPSFAATPTPPTPPRQQQVEEKRDKSKLSSLVISGQIDYDRVARARSAVEKRKKKETTAEVASSSTSPTRATDRSSSSELPSPDEADALLQFDRDAYTDDSWEAMKTIRAYASYVDSLSDVEASPGCELCASNRRALERVWQTVSQEYYPPPGRAFSQAAWALRLPETLRAAGGALRDASTARAAARDLVSSLGDRYTEYLPPEAYRAALRRPLAGELRYAAARAAGGVGIVVEGPDGRTAAAKGFGNGARVAAVLAESSAEAAGVEPGDVVVEVDGHRASRLGVDELGALLRGPEGSSATVVVRKGGGPSPRPRRSPLESLSPLSPLLPTLPAAATPREGPTLVTLDLERRPIPQPPVKAATLSTARGRPVAYIRLHYFARDATRALAGAVLAAEARGDEGILLDLRNNPGGVFEEAVADAAMFLRRGATIASTTRTPPDPSSPSSPPPPVATFVAGDPGDERAPFNSPSFLLRRAALSSAPMAVLVDGGSASGAEVLAGALADNGRAVLVGPRKTFGKGLIQYYFLVDRDDDASARKNKKTDGGAGGSGGSVGGGVRVTVAGYRTPAGHDPSAEGGLEPQRLCVGHGSGPAGSSSLWGAAPSAAPVDGERDGCLDEALRALDEQIDRSGFSSARF